MRETIENKVLADERISVDEAVWLMECPDIPWLSEMATIRRKQRVGDKAFYQFNFNINYTNICENECKLCAFYREEGDDGAFTLSIPEIEAQIRQVRSAGVNEVHVVGALNKKIPYSYYVDLLKAVKNMDPKIHIQAFTAVEIAFFAELAGKTSMEVLSEFKKAGLDSIPGGGAEIFSPRVRKLICEKKLPGKDWLRIHEEAHSIGITTNATMLYGHVETRREIVDHMESLRALQDKTGGLKAFVPLAFFRDNTEFESTVGKREGVADMCLMATARIFLDNIDHLKSMWMIYGYKECQVGLEFGADDIGGTYYDEIIVHSAGAETPRSLTKNEICSLIRKAGRTPVKVNSDYEIAD